MPLTHTVSSPLLYDKSDAIPFSHVLQSKLSKLNVAVDLSQHDMSVPLHIKIVSEQRALLRNGNNSSNKQKGLANPKSNGKKQSKKGESSTPGASIVVATTNDLHEFDWDLGNSNDHTRLVVQMPVQAVAQHWHKADMFVIEWCKGSQRPYVVDSLQQQQQQSEQSSCDEY